MGAIDRRQRSAPIDRREPAGIAMRQDLDPATPALRGKGRLDQAEPVLAERAIDRDILLGDGAGPGERGGDAPLGRQIGERAAHLRERPGEIDRGRAGRGKGRGSLFDAAVGRVLGDRQRHAIGGRGADQRGAAHLHVADRPRCVVEPGETRDDELVRQPRLVDDFDRLPVGGEPDRAHRPASDFHRRLTFSGPGRPPRRAGRGAPGRGLRAR